MRRAIQVRFIFGLLVAPLCLLSSVSVMSSFVWVSVLSSLLYGVPAVLYSVVYGTDTFCLMLSHSCPSYLFCRT